MSADNEHESSQLFLVRLWLDNQDGRGAAGHGKVQHVMSGEARAFEDWPSLIDQLSTLARARNGPTQMASTAEAEPS